MNGYPSDASATTGSGDSAKPVVTCLIAIKGHEPATSLGSIVDLLTPDVKITLVHVIDDRAAQEVSFGREGYLLRRGLRTERVEAMLQADEAAAAGMFVRTKTLLRPGQEDGVQTALLRGVPERELVRLAGEIQANVVIVFGRNDPGPKSIGKVARFVIDHVTCTAIVIREPAARSR